MGTEGTFMTITQSATAVEAATAVMAAHDRAYNSGDLDAIMANVAADVVVLAPGARLVEGKEAFRDFYVGMLHGSWAGNGDVTHRFAGAEEAGDVVVLHGVASGAIRPPGTVPIPVANNFLILLKPDVTGAYKIWRAAFGPAER